MGSAIFYSPKLQLKTVTNAGRLEHIIGKLGTRKLPIGGTVKSETEKSIRQLIYPISSK